MSTLGLANLDGRCSYGYAPVQHPALCECSETEWAVFVRALRAAIRDDGSVHVNDVRPKIRGHIEPKHIGLLWRRARANGLIRHSGWEQSTDRLGANDDKQSRVYAWLGERTAA